MHSGVLRGAGLGRQGHKKSSGDYWLAEPPPVVMQVSCRNCWHVYWARTAHNVVCSLEDRGARLGRQGHKKSSGDYWQSLYLGSVARIAYWARTVGNVVCSFDDPAGMEKYPYIHHLLEFEQRVGGAPVPAWLQKVATPLILREWSKELKDHPDAEFRGYILNGIRNGFRIGFN